MDFLGKGTISIINASLFVEKTERNFGACNMKKRKRGFLGFSPEQQ